MFAGTTTRTSQGRNRCASPARAGENRHGRSVELNSTAARLTASEPVDPGTGNRPLI